MKVFELIALLKQVPRDATVVVPETSHGAFYVTSYVEAGDPEFRRGEQFDAEGGSVETADVVVIG